MTELPGTEPVPGLPAPSGLPCIPSGRRHAGVFIALEGGDGTGKSTQVALLAEWLTAHGIETVLTREPGGTELGVLLREALLHGGEIDPRTEALLFATDRAHHVASLVRPALEQGAVVVTDRYLDSSIAYQGSARRLGREEVRQLSLWATYGLLPDLTIVLDMPPAAAAARWKDGTQDRLEREAVDFHERVRTMFLTLAAEEPGRYQIVDASDEPEAVHERVVAGVAGLLRERGLAGERSPLGERGTLDEPDRPEVKP
ncbi:MAG TPA: dTMP kinase [Actinomycetaceae bacterium]|nr:dTMP kinase [Actinomycetaceae bacterium]